MFDFAVVGSGVGGASIAALLSKKGYKVVLFEKDGNLGGCSSSFYHKGFLYNTGATTLAGYEEGGVVKEVFDQIGFNPELKECSVAMEVLHNGKRTKRYKDFSKFLAQINKNYPHEKHDQFWKLVYTLNKEFHELKGYYYSNKTPFAKLYSLCSFIPFIFKFRKYIFVNAAEYIEKFYGKTDKEYKEFLEAQVRIVAQAKLKEINFFTAAAALAYTFNKNYYVAGGFQKLFKGLSANVDTVLKNTQVKNIKKRGDYFELETQKQNYFAKRVILNSTVYQSAELFEDKKIQKEFRVYEKLDNKQGCFVCYITLKTDRKFEYHYQLIKNNRFIHSISNALFVSFGDDLQEGYISITASIHTDYRIWYDNYKQKKQELEDEIVKEILQTFSIQKSEIENSFSASPQTFKRYINREQAGGNPMSMKNFLPKLPANDTRIDGLYRVGDTTFAAQGWPGVMMGVKNLSRLLDV